MSQLLLLYGSNPARSTHLWGQDPLFFVFQDLLLTVVEFRQPRQLFAHDVEFMPRKKTVHRDLSHRGKKTRQLVLGTEGILSSPNKQARKKKKKKLRDLWSLALKRHASEKGNRSERQMASRGNFAFCSVTYTCSGYTNNLDRELRETGILLCSRKTMFKGKWFSIFFQWQDWAETHLL